MPGLGYESYFILGEQLVDWDTQAAALLTTVYEPVSFGLKGIGDNVIPQRFSLSPSPMKPVKARIGCEGTIVMHLHSEDMLVFWEYILMDAAIASVDFTAQEIYGDGGGGTKAWATPASLDAQPTATTPVSSPGRISATVSVADSGTIVITGTNYGDQPITETLTFGAETGPITTTNYFKTVDASGIVTSDGMDSGDLLLTCDRNIYTHTIAEADAIRDGWTVEAVIGGLPSVFVGVLPNSGQIDIANPITMTLNCIGKREFSRYKFLASQATPTKSDSPTAVGAYSSVNDVLYPDWSLEVDFDASGTPIPVANASYLFNNNYGYLDRFNGNRNFPKPVRTANRDIVLTCGVDYEAAGLDYVLKHLNLDEIAVTFTMKTVESSGALKTTVINMPQCSLGAYPAVEASDYASTLHTLELRPHRSAGAVSSDEVNVVVESIEASI